MLCCTCGDQQPLRCPTMAGGHVVKAAHVLQVSRNGQTVIGVASVWLEWLRYLLCLRSPQKPLAPKNLSARQRLLVTSGKSRPPCPGPFSNSLTTMSDTSLLHKLQTDDNLPRHPCCVIAKPARGSKRRAPINVNNRILFGLFIHSPALSLAF